MKDMFAVAEFGSSCRSEIDSDSDRDLLVVCAPTEKYRLLKTYRSLGYSVSFYNEYQLRGMRKFGSLFLQHLRHESKILEDADGEFAEFLDTCDFVRPSSTEMLRCQDGIIFVLSLQLGALGDAWKSDFLFCLIRDYLIKLLASRDAVAFGIPAIYEAGRRFWGLDKFDLKTLVTLRELKAQYRRGDKSFLDDQGLFRSTARLLQKTTPMISEVDLSQKVSIESLAHRPFLSSYERLRVLEVVYGLYRMSNPVHPEHFRILALVEQPNMYGGASKRGEEEVARYLHQLIVELMANKSLQRTFEVTPVFAAAKMAAVENRP